MVSVRVCTCVCVCVCACVCLNAFVQFHLAKMFGRIFFFHKCTNKGKKLSEIIFCGLNASVLLEVQYLYFCFYCPSFISLEYAMLVLKLCIVRTSLKCCIDIDCFAGRRPIVHANA